MMVELKENERFDDLQRNGRKIIQNSKRFCFGMDAVLLTVFATVKTEDKVIDFGTGTGIIPILLEAKYGGTHYTGLEIQYEMADMARRSVLYNQLQKKIDIITGDIKEASRLFGAASFDVVTCNPPYMSNNHGLKNACTEKTIARHEVLCTLDDIVNQGARLLKTGGRIFMVHRPHRAAEVISALKQYNLEPKRIQFVHPFINQEANMFLVEAVRGGRPMLKVEKPIIVYEKPGVYTEEIFQVYGY